MDGNTYADGLQAIETICNLMQRSGLGPAEVKAIVALAKITDGDATTCVSRRALAEQLRVSEARYKVLQQRLVRTGFVISCQTRRSAAAPSVARRGLTEAGWAFIEAVIQLTGPTDSPATAGSWPLPPAEDVDDISFDANTLAPMAPASARPPSTRVDQGIEDLGVLQKDAAVVLDLVEDAVRPFVADHSQEQVLELCLQALWSCLVGSTAHRGWSYAARVKGVASLVRSGRWGRPRAMPKGWETLAAAHVRLEGRGTNVLH
jgi:hypothetical protein